jgi:diguanylate cyclase
VTRPSTPAPDLAAVAGVVLRAADVEGLVRPLLAALQQITGLATARLTVVHGASRAQEVRYLSGAVVGGLVEGIDVPWDDALCKRALDAEQPFSADVRAAWPDAGASSTTATHLCVPVRLVDGRLWGTLCASDPVRQDDAVAHLPVASLFATLISAAVERAAAVARERTGDSRVGYETDTDELTGCRTRRTIEPWLASALAARVDDEVVVVAVVDVDRFSGVNERLGTATGDVVLASLGGRLLGSARGGDLVARVAGDQFVLGARLPRGVVASLEARVRLAGRFVVATSGGAVAVHCSTGFASSDDAPDVAALLSRSRGAMVREKAIAPA